jgi:hypothetical protein
MDLRNISSSELPVLARIWVSVAVAFRATRMEKTFKLHLRERKVREAAICPTDYLALLAPLRNPKKPRGGN